MKSVLISIQPKWCELICTFLGYDNRRPLYKKRLELRKSAPKTTPFKAYIYETQGRNKISKGRRQVIGEFICDYVVRYCEMSNADLAEEMSCVPREDILKYSNGKEVFGWHISDLVIYDKPKELSKFYKPCENLINGSCKIPYPFNPCAKIGMTYERVGKNGEHRRLVEKNACLNVLRRPPQSWCYVGEGKQ